MPTSKQSTDIQSLIKDLSEKDQKQVMSLLTAYEEKVRIAETIFTQELDTVFQSARSLLLEDSSLSDVERINKNGKLYQVEYDILEALGLMKY